MILPLKTACAAPSTMRLVQLAAAPFGSAWSMSGVRVGELALADQRQAVDASIRSPSPACDHVELVARDARAEGDRLTEW